MVNPIRVLTPKYFGCSQVFNGVLLFFFLPQRQVLLEEFDDRLSISESLFINIINLLEGLGQGLLTKLTGFLVVVHHLVVEHREVKGQSKSDWVAGIEALASSLCVVVVLEGSVLNSLELISLGVFSNVSVVVTHHLLEEGLGLISRCNSEAGILDVLHDLVALVEKLLLNLLLVLLESTAVLGILGVLLNGRDGPDGSSLGSDLVLEAD